MGGGARVGLVGCGRWGRLILRDLVALGCEVVVAVPSQEGRKAALGEGAHEVVGDLHDLRGVDGIVVATPTKTHAEVAEAALEHGKPVFVEKPLTNDPAAAERVADLAPDRLFVMDKWRYHPGVEALAAIARDEELGAVVGLRTMRLGWGNPHDDVDAIWILAPHELSIGLEILGHVAEPRAALADALDGYATGLIGLLGERPWLALEVSTRAAERRREVHLLCERGVAVLPDAYSPHVCVFTSGPTPELRQISDEMPLLRELQAFVQHLGGGPPPRSSAAEGALVVERIGELRRLAGLSS